jgi:hypothetical protein
MATLTTPTRKPTLKRGSKPYLFHVESTTRPGIFHVVDVHRLTCTCEAGRARRGGRHLRLALAYHDWRTRQLAQSGALARPSGMVALQDAVAQRTRGRLLAVATGPSTR